MKSINKVIIICGCFLVSSCMMENEENHQIDGLSIDGNIMFNPVYDYKVNDNYCCFSTTKPKYWRNPNNYFCKDTEGAWSCNEMIDFYNSWLPKKAGVLKMK